MMKAKTRNICRRGTARYPAQMKIHIRKLQRELFCLWSYIGQEGLWDEAREYVDEHADIPTLFESP